MIQRSLSIALLLLLPAVAAAQSKDEIKFCQTQAKRLVDYADKAFKKGFPRQAKLIYLMVLSDYDPDNADAHKALGHTKNGSAWVPDPKFKFPKNDQPNPAAAKLLRHDYEKLAEKLVRAHKRMAEKYQKAGRTDMAMAHYKSILRFSPDDEDAKKNLELVDVGDGLSGTSLEQNLYKRGVMLDDAVEHESAKTYPVERLPDTDRNPLLDKAQVTYNSVKSEHFVIRGDYEPEVLEEAAVWSERSYHVVSEAFAGYEKYFLPDTKKWSATQYAFFKTRDTYKQILQANRDLFRSKEQFDFILEHTGGTALPGLRVSAAASKKRVLDGAVRGVARSFAALASDALNEGIGHTFVGLMLRNNRAFLVDLQEQLRTQTEEDEIDEFNPDMDLWEELALEQAWKKTTVPAVQLPLIHASKFDDEARIKAWSFCHYLVLRDPTLLRWLDACSRFKNVIDVEKNFTAKTKVSIAQLDKEWKDFFTGATPVLRAIKKHVDPLTVVSKDVKKWLDAINKIRTEDYHAAPVNWSATFSTRCKEHADYLRNNELSGPVEEQREQPDLPGSSHPGNLFAQMAMVAVDSRSPEKTIEEWMQYPGYRDVFFVNTLKTIGIFAEKGVVVLNVVQGIVTPRAFSFWMFPKSGATRVPTSVKVADLGPELATLLAENGHEGQEVVGYPLSLHFGTSDRMPKRDSLHCQVTVNDRENVEGLLDIADDGANRRTASPGLVVFYPLKPINKGSKVKVEWTFEHGRRLEKFNAVYYH